MSAEAINLIQHCFDTKEPYLDLGNCGLTDQDVTEDGAFDKLLGLCTHLQTLILSTSWWEWHLTGERNYKSSQNVGRENKFNTHPPALKKLTNLMMLVFSGENTNKWGTIDMAFVAELTNLKYLHLGNNEIEEIKGLESLTNLQLLDIHSNQICEIKGLDNLIALQILDIQNNNIQEIKGLDNLVTLQKLDIYSNKIKEIKGLDNLIALRQLSISYNQIKEIKGLENLTALQNLDIHFNDIKEIKGLERLTALKQLDISGNQIQEIKGLEKLTELRQLDIHNNLITNASNVTNLTNLEHLNLDEKDFLSLQPFATLIESHKVPIKHIPQNYSGVPNIELKAKPIFPPPAILAKGEVAIIAYFNSLKKGTKPLNEVKILLIGDGAAGKTSLVNQLCGKAFDEKERQTHGIQIKDSSFSVFHESIKVHYWDFGGQEIMHATHQFFLTKDCVYVVVLDGRKDERPEYWLKHIAVFGGNAPVLVVLNKCEDNKSYDIEQQELKFKFSNIKDFYKISCKTNEGIGEFVTALKQQLYELPFRKTAFSPDWTNVKEQLREMTEPYITYSKYYGICDDLLVTDKKEQQTLLDYLNSLGIILHFEALKQYDTQVLNPLWLTQAVYRIINSPIVARQNGEFNEDQLYDILNDSYFDVTTNEEASDNDLLIKIMNWFGFKKQSGIKKGNIIKYAGNIRLAFIAKAMQQFELSYSFSEGNYIIPDLLPIESPVKINYQQFTLRFSTDFYFLPPALLPRFMVQTHQHIKDSIRWRNGVMLNAEGVFDAIAIVRVDKENKQLDIYLKGRQQRELLSYIRSVLQGLYNSYEGLKEPERIKEWLFLPNSDIKVELAEIEGLSKRNKKEYSSGKIDKDYLVADLKASIESPEYPLEKEEQPIKIFVSYSRVKRKFRDELTTKLHLLTKSKDNFIELWIDEKMMPGANWKKEIDDALKNSDIVICLLSDEYFQSDYCMYEAEKARSQEKIIYPILINTCAWRDTFFANINGYFITAIEPVIKAKRPEHWQRVYTGVKQLIKR